MLYIDIVTEHKALGVVLIERVAWYDIVLGPDGKGIILCCCAISMS